MAITRITYLGETDVTDAYKTWTPAEFALVFIEKYGQIDGAHHKQWVLDQVTRILLGTPVIVKLAKWHRKDKDGETSEVRFTTDEPSEKYLSWVRQQRGFGNEVDGYEYDYNEGIAP